MTWEKPSFIEVEMSSEIGGYQEDDLEERVPVPTDRREQAKLGDGMKPCEPCGTKSRGTSTTPVSTL
jgi:hypothetical protein